VPAPSVEFLESRLLMARVEGIDVSSFQGSMNFTTAYNQNKRFAFIRASRSDTIPDSKTATFVPAAKNAGLVVGVYHRALPFSNTGDSGAFRDPIVDADAFLSVATQYIANGYMRPVLDLENGSSLNAVNGSGQPIGQVNGYTLNEWAVAWINRVKTVTGVTPMMYR
jgi:GH25 family lysozyme M1 (1,4-beta-N-acetylmuramidase)